VVVVGKGENMKQINKEQIVKVLQGEFSDCEYAQKVMSLI
jgi:hypothetical protein